MLLAGSMPKRTLLMSVLEMAEFKCEGHVGNPIKQVRMDICEGHCCNIQGRLRRCQRHHMLQQRALLPSSKLIKPCEHASMPVEALRGVRIKEQRGERERERETFITKLGEGRKRCHGLSVDRLIARDLTFFCIAVQAF